MQVSTIKNLQATMALHGFYGGNIDGNWTDESHAAFYKVIETAIANNDIKPSDKPSDKPDVPTVDKINSSKYKLSNASLSKLSGVYSDLVNVVNRAIQITKMDFAVNEGLRTVERQRKLVNSGASQTMKSNHITGRAVDLVPTPNGKMDWNDWSNYYVMCEAMQKAAEELNVLVRWGGCWETINGKTGNPKAWVEAYGARKKREGKKVFTDGPHFELV